MLVHFIQNNVVINTVEQDTLDNPFGYFAVADEAAGIGWTWDGEKLVAPPAPPTPVPSQVTMRQARLALLGAGLLSNVDMAIESMPEPTKSAAKIEWEYAAVVERNAGLVPAMASALGMTETQIDDLFIAAAAL